MICHHRDAAATAGKDRRIAPALLVGSHRSLHFRQIEWDQCRQAGCQQADAHFHRRRRDRFDVIFQVFVDLVRILVADQAGAELGTGLLGDNRLGTGPVQPLHMPLMSSVGRAEMRSRMV